MFSHTNCAIKPLNFYKTIYKAITNRNLWSFTKIWTLFINRVWCVSRQKKNNWKLTELSDTRSILSQSMAELDSLRNLVNNFLYPSNSFSANCSKDETISGSPAFMIVALADPEIRHLRWANIFAQFRVNSERLIENWWNTLIHSTSKEKNLSKSTPTTTTWIRLSQGIYTHKFQAKSLRTKEGPTKVFEREFHDFTSETHQLFLGFRRQE